MSTHTVVAALIPARAGSKGVPDKNTEPIHGRSLVERAIECAKRVPEIGLPNIYVSTDSCVAAKQAGHLSAKVISRPAELATDDSPMILTVMHALQHMDPKPDILVLLQPTTPSRTWQMVQDGIQRLLRQPEVGAIVSVVRVPIQYSPDLVMVEREGRLVHYHPGHATSRQQATMTLCRDGSFYTARVSSLELYGSLYAPVTKPHFLRQDESLNIDAKEDWDRAQLLLR